MVPAAAPPMGLVDRLHERMTDVVSKPRTEWLTGPGFCLQMDGMDGQDGGYIVYWGGGRKEASRK
jgi:hypothetical protein